MYIFFILVVACAAYYYFVVMKQIQRKKDDAEQFQRDHPEASKVYLKTGMTGLLTSEEVTILGVNDNEPVLFYEGLKQGFFLMPGKSVIEVSCSWTRPGVLHKNVTTEVAPSKQEVEAEAGKAYRLGFDRDAETYVFEELTAAI